MNASDEMTTPNTKRPAGGLLRVLGLMALLMLLVVLGGAMTAGWIYGTTTRHADRDSIWMSDRGRSLIPPTAQEIQLQRDLLDHRALYRITEAELNAFLDRRFARDGESLDSHAERYVYNSKSVGEEIGTLGWTVTAGSVSYSYFTPNGAASHFYHDPKTGLTYQESAYW